MSEFYKGPTLNTNECCTRQSLVVKKNASESDAGSDFEPDLDKGKQIIDVEPSAVIATTKVQHSELEDPEEGECLFHSQMWVKGIPLCFIIDSSS